MALDNNTMSQEAEQRFKADIEKRLKRIEANLDKAIEILEAQVNSKSTVRVQSKQNKGE